MDDGCAAHEDSLRGCLRRVDSPLECNLRPRGREGTSKAALLALSLEAPSAVHVSFDVAGGWFSSRLWPWRDENGPEAAPPLFFSSLVAATSVVQNRHFRRSRRRWT